MDQQKQERLIRLKVINILLDYYIYQLYHYIINLNKIKIEIPSQFQYILLYFYYLFEIDK